MYRYEIRCTVYDDTGYTVHLCDTFEECLTRVKELAILLGIEAYFLPMRRVQQ
jgi:predicted RNase H-like HicB family nuclease